MDFQKENGRIYAEKDGEADRRDHLPGGERRGGHRPHLCGRSLRGQGVADRLVRAAADQIRGEGRKARPVCSYARAWFDRHPEEGDLLAD